jgi:hypothetical protein
MQNDLRQNGWESLQLMQMMPTWMVDGLEDSYNQQHPC